MLVQVRGAVRRWLRERGIPDDDAAEILVACGEACANAVQHAYSGAAAPGPLAVEAHIVEGTLEMCVRDHGRWRAPVDRGGGWGLQLMQGLMDDVEVKQTAAGTTVRLRRDVAIDGTAVSELARLETRRVGETQLVSISGEVDLSNARPLLDAVAAARARRRRARRARPHARRPTSTAPASPPSSASPSGCASVARTSGSSCPPDSPIRAVLRADPRSTTSSRSTTPRPGAVTPSAPDPA